MKMNVTYFYQTSLRLMAASVLLFIFGQRASAQITTNPAASCNNEYFYCSLDTVTLAPANTVDFANFVWYGGGEVTPANEIVMGNAASFNVDPNRLGNNTIYITAPGGTYILTSEYDTPSGCATLNDTLIINFLPVPDLVTTLDSICQAAGESSDLTSLVMDNNSTAGSMAWYPTLADAQAETNALSTTAVTPTVTTKYYVRKNTTATDSETAACYNIDSTTVEVRCLSIGNYVWYDTDNDRSIDGTESPIEGVTVNLFHDADANGLLEGTEQTPYASYTTGVDGLYIFENLAEGKYFVGIPSTEFGSGETLHNLYSSGTSIAADGTISEISAPSANLVDNDNDDNGTTVTSGFYNGGVMTDQIMLAYNTEPTGETPNNSTNPNDADANLAADFGFYGMSIGSLVFMDTDNSGAFDGSDMGIANVTVNLYSADGNTLLSTTTTNPDGQYLFAGLAEGDYMVGVDTTVAALDGKISADDIATSGMPNTTDNDDNGVTFTPTEVRSNVFTLNAGNAPTGEADQGETTTTGLGSPAVTDNPNTPDANSNLHVDFGFKPVCPTITNPQGAQTICATDSGTDLSVETDQNTVDIRFVRFTTAQTGNAMYSGGTQIGSDVTPSGASNPFGAGYTFNTSDFPNATTAPITYYVYAILATAPADPTCRPYQEIQVVVNPLPTATAASLTLCETMLGGGEADFDLTDADLDVLNGQTGMTVTYHTSQADADAGINPLSSPYTAAPKIIVARVENTYGCYATANISLNVNAKPDFTLSLPTTCPGDEPTVLLNNLTNGDAILSLMDLNNGGFASYAANTVFKTAEGLLLNANNTVTVRNENGCETAKVIAVPDITRLVCPRVNVNVIRNGQ